MNIEDQVLSINQVQQLQELGFDVEKYASMAFLNFSSCIPPKYSITNYQREIKSKIEYIPTLTIGDIIEILPEKISEIYYIEIGKNYIDYCSNDKSLNGFVEDNLINALFETLKWCIINRHIES